MTWSPDAATASVFATLIFNGVVGAVVLSLFECLRIRKLDIYTPNSRRDTKGELPVSSNWPLGWIASANQVSDLDILRRNGMDAYVYLRFVTMIFRILLLCSSFGLATLLPVYGTAYGTTGVAGINRYSMANITQQGVRLWASFACAYVFTIIFLFFIDREYKNFSLVRAQFFQEVDSSVLPPQMAHTILVENVPPKLRAAHKLHALFEGLFPGEVFCVSLPMPLPELEKVVAERRQLLIQLEKATLMWESPGRDERPLITDPSKKKHCCDCSRNNKVDAIEFYIKEIKKAGKKISMLQKAARTNNPWSNPSTSNHIRATTETNFVARVPPAAKASTSKTTAVAAHEDPIRSLVDSTYVEAPDAEAQTGGRQVREEAFEVTVPDTKALGSSSALITFKSRTTAMTASQSRFLTALAPYLLVQPAPAPADILWQNTSVSQTYTYRVSLLTSVMYYAGLAFWTVILAFIAVVSNLSTIEKYLPFLKSLNTETYAVLQGLLPVLIMIIVLALVPVFMAFIARSVERRKTNTAVQLEVFKWYYLYQLLNVYLLLLAGSAVSSITDIIDNPTSVVRLVAAALPTTAVFFLNFTITQICLAVPLKLLNIVPVLLMSLYRGCIGQDHLTRRSLFEGPLAPGSISYGTALPSELYLLSIALLYWVISPIQLFAATVYFGFNSVALKYQLAYVLPRTSIETGGMYWFGLYTFSMQSLMVATILFIVFVGIKEGIVQTPLLVPIPILILLSWRRTETLYKRTSKYEAYASAVEGDHSQDTTGGGSRDNHSASTTRGSGYNTQQDVPTAPSTSCGSSSASMTSDTYVSRLSVEYLLHPALSVSKKVYPYPYRMPGHPQLIDPKTGLVDPVYFEDIPEGEDPAMFTSRLQRAFNASDDSSIVSTNAAADRENKGKQHTRPSALLKHHNNNGNNKKKGSVGDLEPEHPTQDLEAGSSMQVAPSSSLDDDVGDMRMSQHNGYGHQQRFGEMADEGEEDSGRGGAMSWTHDEA